ncbi:YlxQ family RNA-binding protein [Thermoflavimicrobium dichotomicum]|uniref:Ribosomal protein L7Ae n=1 Tax=Thermoflavimicrobium dichotomicum TaxID=46223 RepID=A0A1I3PP55_9BACL|nr:YlxQ family RNA-binding protein [Thermoflavimicrobium dichotomicum]SFJ23292.1 Ribosomal protein L7Ae [Thermoflavimicrobium dichotomicum]
MNKLLNALGLAMRAGKVVSGEEFVIREVRAGKAKLVVLAKDAAKNTEKKLTDKCQSYQVPLIRFGTRQELGKAIGKAERVVIAVTDPGFAKMIRQLAQ